MQNKKAVVYVIIGWVMLTLAWFPFGFIAGIGIIVFGLWLRQEFFLTQRNQEEISGRSKAEEGYQKAQQEDKGI